MSSRLPRSPERRDLVASLAFEADVISWRGPAPFVFAPIPEDHTSKIKFAAKVASYGWGVVPVEAEIGAVTFSTSLFPRGGNYLLPIKIEVQKKSAVKVGDRIKVKMRIYAK